ncbi:MAG: aminoacyl-tRNA hydrolase [Campylobacteraceae bacterium]
MILFVGLGNPGKKYEKTRHNIGFMVIDHLVGKHKATSINKKEFQGELFKHNQSLFLKPTTFMNLSGESVFAVSEYYKPEKIVVFHDDIAINLGSVRIKLGGSSGGHNGIKSIDKFIGSEYIRVRLGVGEPSGFLDTSDYVLSSFKIEEINCVQKLINYSEDIAEALTKNSLEDVIIHFTSKKGICID